jgi:eukaryotic-like serine/threonine-protein kinase
MALQIVSQAEPIAGYRLIDRIGGGGFGDVWKAEAPGGLIKAIKIIHGDLRTADRDGARHAEQELKALKRVQEIRHPFLLSLERYDIIEGRLLIVMELADCNLWDRFRDCRSQGLPGIPREELLGYMEESAEVLDLMNNSYGLQHLDIKPQNLFLIHNHVKVADFGLVKDLEGVRAAITGGVTPVYAAPETFDGVATRFCDQYSLSIVYQELLTGVRPISGANAQQLLVQHLQGLPNLSPLPAADRPVVGRSLSKKPEDRFPSCLEFVKALYQAGSDQINGAFPGTSPMSAPNRMETPAGNYSTVGAYNRSTGGGPHYPAAEPPPETPKTELRFQRINDIQTSSPGVEVGNAARVAPPEQTGPGALLPAVVIGLGASGIEAVKRFRRQVVDRYGSFERLPNLRLICMDTDQETLRAATSSNLTAPLTAGEVVPMPLNRASHYLKPRRNGRSIIEGWFDPQTLYRIPRHPQTLGLRCLGRLAFCDHYRLFAEKLRENLEACTGADAMARAERVTKLGLRTNRPRVYVVTGLGGGAGSGMFIDVAYAVRYRLRQLGYAEPDVVGLLLVPPPDRASVKPQAMGNTFAALKELNHYSLAETVYSVAHDDRDGHFQDAGPPFSRFYVSPQDVLAKAADPAAPLPQDLAPERVADYLRRDLLSQLGRVVDESRSEFKDSKLSRVVTTGSVNQASYVWPKQQILSQASRWLGEALVNRWLKADINVIREPVRAWLKERWAAEELGPEQLIAKLYQAAEKKAGQPLETLFAEEAQPFAPRGWFARDPDSTRLWQALTKLTQLVGMPDERAMQRQVGSLELALNEAADQLIRDLSPKLTRLPRSLLEHSDYRLAGAVDAIKQLDMMIAQLLEHYEPMLNDMAAKATEGYYVVHSYLAAEPHRRKPSPAEISEGLRTFPKWRCQSLVHRQVCRIYLAMRSQLADLDREFQFCRQRLDDLMSRFRGIPIEELPRSEFTLFPPGCSSIQQAVNALRESVRPEEMRALDKALQKNIEQAYQALFSVCMSSINMLGNLHGIVEEQARAFLAERLGDCNVGEMFFARFADTDQALQAIKRIHEQAAPPVRSSRPIMHEVCALAVPEGMRQGAFQQIGRQALPGKALDFVPSSEEILVFREWPRFPLTALPQLSPMAEDAYAQMQQSGQNTPHTRSDVGKWFDIDS